MTSKKKLLESLNRFNCAPALTPSPDVDKDTHVRPAWKTPNTSVHHLPEHINQDIKSRQSKGKDLKVNKTKYRS